LRCALTPPRPPSPLSQTAWRQAPLRPPQVMVLPPPDSAPVTGGRLPPIEENLPPILFLLFLVRRRVLLRL
jgi:hypothetical protein